MFAYSRVCGSYFDGQGVRPERGWSNPSSVTLQYVGDPDFY